jgi:hypothetical protein
MHLVIQQLPTIAEQLASFILFIFSLLLLLLLHIWQALQSATHNHDRYEVARSGLLRHLLTAQVRRILAGVRD